MSLLPVKSLSGSLPELFIEARLQGSLEIESSHMGISFDSDQYHIALLMRTSGVFVVASVGSYMMYRVCSRLLGRDFIWTILEQARLDLLSRNETCLLNPRMPYVVNNEEDGNCSETTTDQINDHSTVHSNDAVFAAMLSSENSPQKYQLQVQEEEFRSSCKKGSKKKLTQPASKHNGYSMSITSRSSSQTNYTSSDKSASFHLLWDDPRWDEETDFTNIRQRDRYSVVSDVSNMTEFQAAQGLFDGSDDCRQISLVVEKNSEIGTDECISNESENCELDSSDFIRKSCMSDSKHLYHITTGYITTTDSMSVSSERSSRSFMSLKQRLIANASSSGLLELVQTTVSLDQLQTIMTDSGISKGTTVSSSNLLSNRSLCYNKNSEAFLSDDEAVGLNMSYSFTSPSLSNNKVSVIRRTNLNQINEDRCSPTTSTRSMEWFDDDYCPFHVNQNCNEKLSMESGKDEENPLAACFNHSTFDKPNANTSESIKHKYLLNVTRDLMAWAREQFTPKSHQLKALQSLYVSHCRWRRIGLKYSSNSFEQFLTSLLHLMLLRRIHFFGCTNMQIIAKVCFLSSKFLLTFMLH